MPVFAPEGFANNQRKHGRVRTQDIATSLGPVLDISASGMRVRCTTPVKLSEGQELAVTLAAPGGPLLVRVCIMWIKKRMLGAREAGVRFLDVTPSLRAALTELGRSAVYNGRVGEADEWMRKSA